MSDDIEKVIADGKRAGQLLADPVVRQSLDAIMQTEIQKIIGSSPEQSAIREQAYYTIHAVQRLEMAMSTARNNGVFEEDKAKRTRKH
jgi:hypothetical protein